MSSIRQLQLLFFLLHAAFYCTATSELSYVTEDAFPYNYINQQGVLSGISVDLLALTWQAMNQPKQPIKVLPWARAYYLLSQKPNVVLFATARTEARDRLFKWACPIDDIKVVLIGAKNTTKSSSNLSQFKHSTIAAMRSDVGEQLLLNQDFNEQYILLTNNYRQLIRLLLAKRVDYISGVDTIIYQAALANHLSLDGYEVKWLLKQEPLCYAFSHAINDSLVARFQAALDGVVASPAYPLILQKYKKLLQYKGNATNSQTPPSGASRQTTPTTPALQPTDRPQH